MADIKSDEEEFQNVQIDDHDHDVNVRGATCVVPPYQPPPRFAPPQHVPQQNVPQQHVHSDVQEDAAPNDDSGRRRLDAAANDDSGRRFVSFLAQGLAAAATVYLAGRLPSPPPFRPPRLLPLSLLPPPLLPPPLLRPPIIRPPLLFPLILLPTLPPPPPPPSLFTLSLSTHSEGRGGPNYSIFSSGATKWCMFDIEKVVLFSLAF